MGVSNGSLMARKLMNFEFHGEEQFVKSSHYPAIVNRFPVLDFGFNFDS